MTKISNDSYKYFSSLQVELKKMHELGWKFSQARAGGNMGMSYSAVKRISKKWWLNRERKKVHHPCPQTLFSCTAGPVRGFYHFLKLALCLDGYKKPQNIPFFLMHAYFSSNIIIMNYSSSYGTFILNVRNENL